MLRLWIFLPVIVGSAAQYCQTLPTDHVGICSELCTSEPDSCPTDQKCCSNGCGHTCQAYNQCQFGSPLQDPATKEQLFCGRGGQRCPHASKCEIHPADKYAVCCPVCPVGRPLQDAAGVDLKCVSTKCPYGSMCVDDGSTSVCCECPRSDCKLSCKQKLDGNGCPLCQCADPCQNQVCRSDEVCVAQDVQCIAPPCDPVPVCKSKAEVCKAKYDAGTCDGNFRQYYYDYSRGRCEPFSYGGCAGNFNNFPTLEQCEKTCRGYDDTCSVGKPLYDMTQSEYRVTCGERVCPRGFFCNNNTESGCCPVCVMKAAVGSCEAAMPRLFYNPATRQCLNFTYGGCEGNANNFLTLQQCQSACSNFCEEQCLISRDPDIRKSCNCLASGDPCQTLKCTAGKVCVIKNIVCVTTPCDQAECVDPCSLPMAAGTCSSSPIQRYFYDKATLTCKTFSYSGCGGTQNNFKTYDECKNICIAPQCPGKVSALQRNGQSVACSTSDSCPHGYGCQTSVCCPCPRPDCLLNCLLARDPATGCEICQCAVDACKDHNCEKDEVCIMKQVQCIRAPCPPMPSCEKKPSVCTLPMVVGPCKAAFPRYYYNHLTGECSSFVYGGCEGNGNNFMTQKDCQRACAAQLDDACFLPRDLGATTCTATPVTKYSFTQNTRACEVFTYSGCGGNVNRYDTKEKCQQACTPPIPKYASITTNDADVQGHCATLLLLAVIRLII